MRGDGPEVQTVRLLGVADILSTISTDLDKLDSTNASLDRIAESLESIAHVLDQICRKMD